MSRFLLKPVLWNTARYLHPSGVRATSGYPKEHGYGHEEWNNSPKMSYVHSRVAYRAFHSERLGDVPFDELSPIVIFLYASHDGIQELVGAAAGAQCLIDREQKRDALVKKLRIRSFWADAWSQQSVRDAYRGERARFLENWDEDLSWIPNWTCPSSMFFQPSGPVTLDPMRIRGTSKLLTMFNSYTSVDAATAMRVLRSVPHALRNEQWHRVTETVAKTTGFSGDIADDIDDIRSNPNLDNTTKQTLVAARIGQGRFRKQVAARWGSACAVNGCGQEEVLRASHIKPWGVSSNKERLDPANGLLLTANFDTLFDRGLLTFDDEGKMLISRTILKKDRKLLGLPSPLRRKPSAEERAFLRYHKEQIFRA